MATAPAVTISLVLRILRCMTDKELVKKLNSLKSIKPEADWKVSNRDLLLSQISNSGACDLSPWKTFSINFNSLMRVAVQPAYALGVFALVLVTAGVFGHNAFSSAKPNDSLYIARIISERAKLSTVLNSEDRNKLAVKFALDHAQDISTVLADPTFNNEENKDQVAKLNANFNREIDTAKNRISYLTPKAQAPEIKGVSELDLKEITTTTEADLFAIAGSEKDNKGVQVVENAAIKTAAIKNLTPTTASKSLEIKVATETEEIVSLTTPTSSSALRTEKTDSILDEAKQLSENKDYEKVSEKLREVGELIK